MLADLLELLLRRSSAFAAKRRKHAIIAIVYLRTFGTIGLHELFGPGDARA